LTLSLDSARCLGDLSPTEKQSRVWIAIICHRGPGKDSGIKVISPTVEIIWKVDQIKTQITDLHSFAIENIFRSIFLAIGDIITVSMFAVRNVIHGSLGSGFRRPFLIKVLGTGR
jgi:hypothetical protein